MNIFTVLGVRYEVFHSRMLHWLLDPKADHCAGDRFWQPFRALIGLPPTTDLSIDDEVKIDATVSGRWRLADLLIRTGDLLILVENKVDPAYQDVMQVQDEILGGKALADAEGTTGENTVIPSRIIFAVARQAARNRWLRIAGSVCQ